MIASIKGKVESLGVDWAIIGVGGIGLQVFMPTSTMSQVGAVGHEVNLYTHLHLREDNVTLYGFASAGELELFRLLINVTGLGPKLALAVLSAMETEQLAMAIATGSTELLTTIPGIGTKMAHRLVLELKDKIGAGMVTTAGVELAGENMDVLAALTSLGYSAAEAGRALASLPRDEKLSLEEKVKLALEYFGGK
ncbi:MAG: Holliday junction branch migration protein RuvA [Dehalococcoidales bacterium]|nr:Holliday junction branch migration protein RuvA [Dehalococcoidales bacterium]